MNKTFLSGNTVRFQAIFKDFAKELTDPSIVNFKLYDYKYKKLSEHNAERLTEGVFYFDYVSDASDDGKTIIVEAYGEIDGKPSIERDSFKIKFINE